MIKKNVLDIDKTKIISLFFFIFFQLFIHTISSNKLEKFKILKKSEIFFLFCHHQSSHNQQYFFFLNMILFQLYVNSFPCLYIAYQIFFFFKFYIIVFHFIAINPILYSFFQHRFFFHSFDNFMRGSAEKGFLQLLQVTEKKRQYKLI